MRRLVLATAAIFTATAPALADPTQGFYVGGQIGYNDIGDIDVGLNDIGIDGVVYGVYGGLNLDLFSGIYVGAEGNFNLGGNSIDSEYGLLGHVGFAASERYALFGRVGYQWVDFDVSEIAEDILGGDLTDAEEDAFEDGFGDDTEGGVLIGIGGQYATSDAVSFRTVVDTIEFDTYRITGGITFHF